MIKVHSSKTLLQPFYTEGPVIDECGNFYFTNLSGGEIMKVNHKGEIVTWATSICPNGQSILNNGDHLVCDSKQAALIRYNKDGNFLSREIDGFCGGEIIRVPNDVITSKKGNIYFTDSVRHDGKVGCIDTSGKQSIIARNLDYPNGLALSNDGKTLFVAESYKNRILAIELKKDHSIGNARIVADLPKHPSNNIVNNLPDGIKVDEKDNIWVAHYGMGKVQILSASGEIVQSISTEFNLTSNLFIKNNHVIITGGFAEPGPGAFVEILFEYE
ncbi:MAG: SMP-30/gluconolactonase/LRE family protein [Ginsengibacter sp.]